MDTVLHIRGDENIAALISQLDLDITREWEGRRDRHVALLDKKRVLAARFLKWRLRKQKVEEEREELELAAAKADWKERARQRWGCTMKLVAESKKELIRVQAQCWEARRQRQQYREQEQEQEQQRERQPSEDCEERCGCQADGGEAATRHAVALRQRDAELHAEVMARHTASSRLSLDVSRKLIGRTTFTDFDSESVWQTCARAARVDRLIDHIELRQNKNVNGGARRFSNTCLQVTRKW